MTSKARHKRNRVIKNRYRRLARKRAKPPRPPDEQEPPDPGDIINHTPPNSPTSNTVECESNIEQNQPNNIQLQAPQRQHKCRYVCRRRRKRLSPPKQAIKRAYRCQFYRRHGVNPYKKPIHQPTHEEQDDSPMPTPKEASNNNPANDPPLPSPSTPVDQLINFTPIDRPQPHHRPTHLPITQPNQLNHHAIWLISAYFRSKLQGYRSNKDTKNSAPKFCRKSSLTCRCVFRCAMFLLLLLANVVTGKQYCKKNPSASNQEEEDPEFAVIQSYLENKAANDLVRYAKSQCPPQEGLELVKIIKQEESIQSIPGWLTTLDQKKPSF